MKKISCILVVLLILLGIGIVSAEKEIVIGALIGETGDSASYSKGIEAAIDLAVSDLNDSYEKAGMNTTVILKKSWVDGTKEGAAKGAEELLAQGVQIFVEPSSSEEVAGILPILIREGMLSINPSTSVKLSKKGDPVIRLAPSDAHLYKSVVAFNNITAGKNNMKGVILARDDLYGGNLSQMMKSHSLISSSGGSNNLNGNNLSQNISKIPNITETILYPQNTRDFTKTLDELNALVTPLIEEYGDKNVIIFTVSFDEIGDLLAQASLYPNLYRARWEGSDSVAMSSTILNNKTAADFAAQTGLTALSFNIAQPKNSDFWRVYDTVKAAGDGHQPGIYEILPYDETLMAAWIMQSNPSTLEDMLYLADTFGKLSYGATGWLKLNKNGDREYGDYFFYQVQKKTDGEYAWVPVYMYADELDTIVPLVHTNSTFMQYYGGDNTL